MKKIFWGIMSICMVILSCKKEHANTNTTGQTPDKGQYRVSFNVGFSQQTADFETNGLKVNSATHGLATTALSDQVDIIRMAVYNSSGVRMHIIKQKSTDSGFGTLTDYLSAGTYTMVVVAGKTGLEITNGIVLEGRSGVDYIFISDSTLNTDILRYNGDYPAKPGSFDKDAFFKKITFTVPGTASQTISLDRITSRAKVIVEDAIPANASVINIAASSAKMFFIGSATPAMIDAFSFSATLTPKDIGTTNYNFTTSAFLAFPTLGAGITCSNSAGETIAASGASKASFLPNKTTVLTGNLFGGSGNPATNGFHFVADTSWSTPPINKPF
jgi:hypothetical protein